MLTHTAYINKDYFIHFSLTAKYDLFLRRLRFTLRTGQITSSSSDNCWMFVGKSGTGKPVGRKSKNPLLNVCVRVSE